MSDEKIPVNQAQDLLDELTKLITYISDSEVDTLFSNNRLGNFLASIFNPQDVSKYPTIAEFFLANKNRSKYIALLRETIMRHYGIAATNKKGGQGFVSPIASQWFENGVMVLEGSKPFEGFLVLYQDGKLNYAIAARDKLPGESMGHEDFSFVSLEELQRILESQSNPQRVSSLDEPLEQLKTLLANKDNDESKYQELLEKYPWILGAQYKTIQRHEKLDDENIPDFTGVRVHDGSRDIFEIKPPFMQVFRKNREFTNKFNDAWNQAERYIDFAHQNQDYLLREKGLRFDNPQCILLIGYNLSYEEIRELRRKERNNHLIKILTYNDLLTLITATIERIKSLKSI